MLKTIFGKTLYEKRWGLLGWSLVVFFFVLVTVLAYPTFKESFGQSLKDVPEGLKNLVGSAADYQRLAGYVNIQIFGQFVTITIIYAVILGSGLIAGDEGEGTLQSLLSHPVSRSQVYFHKLFAMLVLLALFCLSVTLGIVLAAPLVHETIRTFGVSRLLEATLMFWLINIVFAVLAYMLGAATGRRGLSGAGAGLLAFVAYLVTSLAGTVKALDKVNYLSPFRYFSGINVLDSGLDARNVLVLVLICVGLVLVGWMSFLRRDIYSR